MNGELESHYVDTDTESLDQGVEDGIKDALGFWGMTLGGGAEYFFSEDFSVGGDYGIRLLFLGGEASDDDSESHDDFTDTFKTEASASFRVTYAAVSLNYHF